MKSWRRAIPGAIPAPPSPAGSLSSRRVLPVSGTRLHLQEIPAPSLVFPAGYPKVLKVSAAGIAVAGRKPGVAAVTAPAAERGFRQVRRVREPARESPSPLNFFPSTASSLMKIRPPANAGGRIYAKRPPGSRTYRGYSRAMRATSSSRWNSAQPPAWGRFSTPPSRRRLKSGEASASRSV